VRGTNRKTKGKYRTVTKLKQSGEDGLFERWGTSKKRRGNDPSSEQNGNSTRGEATKRSVGKRET